MLAHGLTAALLFLMVGVLYDRSGSRLIANYSGLTMVMPTFATYFLIASIANMAFPLTANFVGEILLFSGIFLVNKTVGYISAVGIFLVSTYSIWLYNRIFFGNIADQVQSYTDIDSLDKFVMQVLLFSIIGLGAYPGYITNFIYFDSLSLLSLNINL